jgi:hypothetical protein
VLEETNKRVKRLKFSRQRLEVCIYLTIGIITIGLSIYNYVLPTYTKDGEFHSHYNNYLIFKSSFHHLIHQQDLYTYYPPEHFDLYKYSPTFALFMAPFAYLPDLPGLILWNLLNAFIYIFAIWNLAIKNSRIKVWMLLFVLLALITSLQNSQSNPLITGLLLAGFVFAERGKFLPAAFLISFTFFIKIFGIAGLAIFIFYPKRWKSAIYILVAFIIFLLMPLVVVPYQQLKDLYISWFHLLQTDHSASYGYSVAGILSSWFNLQNVKNGVLFLGIIAFFIPLFFIRLYRIQLFRYWFVSFLLIWVVIFNHKAESPTFIIAATGVAVWYFVQKRNIINMILIVLTFLFTVLSPTDLFPSGIRETFVKPYSIMALPCLLVWSKILFDIIRQEADLIPSNLKS